MEKMTITRALAELKLLDSRIKKKIGEIICIDLFQERADRALRVGMTKAEFQVRAKGDFDSIKDMIARRRHIKRLVLESNSATGVEISGQQMSVAEAIDRKSAIEYEKLLLERMKQQNIDVHKAIERQRVELETKVLQMLEQSLGSDKTSNKDDYDTIAKPFLDANMYKELDPLNLKGQIEKYDETVDKFLSEVDFVLSESNSRTEIVIEG